ncbi:MAG: aldehyde dehydrogenase family protein [Rhodothermales bacterium]|nr:aldehyde dehydrogenase family protein [Rhodothermales bacterium]MBO6779305.1 aldehyde dehydrogenase family protein [Rhodothermales bacterium]
MRHLLIAGKEVDSGRHDDILNPFDGSTVAAASLARPEHMDRAIEAAVRAFNHTRRMPTHERATILERTAAAIHDEAEGLALTMVRESGKPLQYARGEVRRAQVTFTLAAGACRQPTGEVMPLDLEPRAEGRLLMYERVPRGPVAAISPFNFPLNLIAHKLAPATAVGAPTVLKPPPQCPLTGYRLAEIMLDAGWPPEALSVLHCEPEVAQRMVEDDRLRVLSFTGSDRVGWKLKSLAGKKQVLLELGGNAPCVADETADLDAVMGPIVTGAWANAGQVCIKVQRVFVARARYREFVDRFVRATEDVPWGDPMREDTVVGPLIEPRHVDRVLSWVQEAVQAGATLHTGGTSEGQVVLPTVLTDVPSDAKVCREEVFGPVTVIEPFDTFDEAIARCNDSRFGLQAGIFTSDVGRAMTAFRELDYGGVLINDTPTFRVDNFPYGGTKDSGFGREGVRFAMQEMTEPKVLIMRGMPS